MTRLCLTSHCYSWFFLLGSILSLCTLTSAQPVGRQLPALPFTAEQAAQIIVEAPKIIEVELAPNGERVVYSVARGSLATNQYITELYLQSTRADEPILIARNVQNISAGAGRSGYVLFTPRWCPSGVCLTYFETISTDLVANDARAALVGYDIASRQVTPVPVLDTSTPGRSSAMRPRITTVGRDYQWSPSGRYIAFTAAIGVGKGLDPRRGVSVSTSWMRPGVPNSPGVRRGLFALDIKTGAVEQLTPDSLHAVGGFSWAPDERALAVGVTPDPDGLPIWRSDLVIVDRASHTVRSLVTRPGMDAAPVWSPDGRWIAFCTHNGDKTVHVFDGWPALVPADGGTVIRFSASDTPKQLFYVPHIWWTRNSRAFYYMAQIDMTWRLVYGDSAMQRTIAIPYLTGELPHEDKYSFSADRRWVAYTRESLTMPPELFVRELDSLGQPVGTSRQLTHLITSFPLTSLVRTETLNWPSRDGKFTVHGLLLTPSASWSGGRVREPLPTLVDFKGGPSMVRRGFDSQYYGAQVLLAARGYAVLMPNTRGRGGYGEAFQRGLRDGQSTARLPYEDAMAGLELLVQRGIADPAQLGVYGHSYGGYLTAYTVTQTTRFKAAVVHEGAPPVPLTDALQMGFGPGSDWELLARDVIGFRNPYEPAERARIISESPGFNIDRVSTPVLLTYGVHSPILMSEGRPLFSALRRFNVPSALVVYDEDHAFSRPAAVADNLTRTAEWLDYWVRGVPYPNPDRAKEYFSLRAGWDK